MNNTIARNPRKKSEEKTSSDLKLEKARKAIRFQETFQDSTSTWHDFPDISRDVTFVNKRPNAERELKPQK